MRRDVLAGVDAGATTIRVGVGFDATRVLARATASAVRLADGATPLAALIAGTAREALGTLGAASPARAVVVGAAGAGKAQAAAALEQALRATAIAERYEVVTDVELVLADAFGEGPGIALIAGTGSIAMGRLPNGELVRAGGHGAEAGDPGSGFAIGAAAARLAVVGHDPSLLRLTLDHLGLRDEAALASWRSRATPAEVAALAPAVLRAAAAGEGAATAIVDAAVAELGSLVAALAPRFPGGQVTVAVSGGLFADPWFRRRVAGELGGQGTDVRAGECDGVRGALRLAAGLAARAPARGTRAEHG